MLMMSAKLAHFLIEEKLFAYYKWVSLIDIHGSNQDDDGSEFPT